MIYKIMVSGGPDLPSECDGFYTDIDEAKSRVQQLYQERARGLWVEVTNDNDDQLQVIEDLQAQGWVSGHIITNYENKIPPVFEIEGVSYPPPTFDPEQCTLKDQIVDLLDAADQHYAEFLSGSEPDYSFPLIDAVKILQAAIRRSDMEDGKASWA